MTQPQTLSVGPLTEQSLSQVIRIHQTGLGYSLNSRLGRDHLALLYRAMSRDDQCYVGVAALNDRPVGIVSGTVDSEALKSRLLRSLSIWKALKIGRAFVAHPSLAHQWWNENRIGASVYHDGKEVRAVLTAIVVDADSQTRGVGRQLVSALEQFFIQRHVMTYRLDTLLENSAARAFYKSLSFREVANRADSVVLLRVIGK